MRKTLVIALCLAAGAWAQSQNQPAQKKAAAPAPKTVTIPKDAVPNPGGQSYTWTDKDGKKWVYTKTPFGVMKSPKADDAAGPGLDTTLTKAIDKGDSVRFERRTPFGTSAWEKKKTELTADEQKLFDAQNPKTEQKIAQPE